jgi:hypothetical protein
MGVLWRSGRSALFGRLGVWESVAVEHLFDFRSNFLGCFSRTNVLTGGSQESLSFLSANSQELGSSNHSQETLRKLPALFCPCVGASVRPNSQMTRPSASASANSQFDRASARASANSQMPNLCLASANSQMDLTGMVGRGRVVFRFQFGVGHRSHLSLTNGQLHTGLESPPIPYLT